MASAVIDRDEELAAIGAFLDGVWSGPRALVFAGEAGIGKTLLWETGVAQAKGRVGRVLSCRGAEAEASLSFAALSEIVGPVFDEVSLSLAAPRRRALAVALLLAEPGEERLNPVFRGPSHSVHGSGSAIIATPRNEPLTCNASEPPIGIEPMTYALRGCSQCVARGFEARASFMFAGCCWWRSLAVDGGSGASRGHAPVMRRPGSRWSGAVERPSAFQAGHNPSCRGTCSVLRCRRSLMLAVGRCCCCHRCCQSRSGTDARA